MTKDRLPNVDVIYGESEVYNPVLVTLINSQIVQRTKRINQFGIPDEFYFLKNFSRFDHCLGVMYLLRSLGASEEEQIAGLLHDVSHKAFSHVYDWIAGTTTQESSQDDGHKYFIQNSEIPMILNAYGYSLDRIIDYHNFGLLERDGPQLCADRVDYALREANIELAQSIAAGLIVVDGKLICRDQETASQMGRLFIHCQLNNWGSYEGVARYHLFSAALKRALALGIIDKEDFMLDDEYVVSKLKTSTDHQIQKLLNYLRQKPLPKVDTGIVVYKKFRYVDPQFLDGNKLVKLTDTDIEYRTVVEQARIDNQLGVTIPDIAVL
jgi:uncharacterized protein